MQISLVARQIYRIPQIKNKNNFNEHIKSNSIHVCRKNTKKRVVDNN